MVNKAFALDEDGNFIMREPDPSYPGILEPAIATGPEFLATVARIRLQADRGSVRLHRDLGMPQQAWMVVDAGPILQTLVTETLSKDPHIHHINQITIEQEDGDSRRSLIRCSVSFSGVDGTSADVTTNGGS